jgi:hypothetical protein
MYRCVIELRNNNTHARTHIYVCVCLQSNITVLFIQLIGNITLRPHRSLLIFVLLIKPKRKYLHFQRVCYPVAITTFHTEHTVHSRRHKDTRSSHNTIYWHHQVFGLHETKIEIKIRSHCLAANTGICDSLYTGVLISP